MSLSALQSRPLVGMYAPEVVVEVHLADGLPQFAIVGLRKLRWKKAKNAKNAKKERVSFARGDRDRPCINTYL